MPSHAGTRSGAVSSGVSGGSIREVGCVERGETGESSRRQSMTLHTTTLQTTSSEPISTRGSSSLSSLVDFSSLVQAAREEGKEQRDGVAQAIDMLRHASMIVQMENEEFIEAYREAFSGEREKEEEEQEEGGKMGGFEIKGVGTVSKSKSSDVAGSNVSSRRDDTFETFETGVTTDGHEDRDRKAEGGEQERTKRMIAHETFEFLPGKRAYAGIWPRFERQFWLDSGILVLLGGFLGLVNIGYQYAITSAPKAYLPVDNPGYPLTSVGYFEGQLWWIGIGAGTGLVVGVLREIFDLRAYLGFVGLIQMQDAGVIQSFKVVVCSIASLAGGASVGPEAGFSAIGGGFGALLYKYVLRWRKREHKDGKVVLTQRWRYFVLAGMAGAFSGFLPAPLLGVMLVWELGLPPMAFGLNQVHFLSLLGMAAIPSSAVFYALGDKATAFNPTVLDIPGTSTYVPPDYYFAVGILYGIMGALLAAYYVAVQLVVIAVFRPIKRVSRRVLGERAGRVAIAVVGGTVYGVIGWALPLTMGDGSLPLILPVTYASEADNGVMATSCFFNIIAFWVSVETGFVGGIFTPLLYSGSLLGGVFSNISGINAEVARSCSFVALAAALIPAPLTLVVFAASIFRLGAPYFAPVMACCFTAHILFDGTGAAATITRSLRARRLRIRPNRER